MTKHNHFAIAATVVLNQLLGFLWYSPVLFLSPWVRGLGKVVDQLDRSNPMPYIVSVVASTAACYVISWLVQALKIGTFKRGVGFGAILWFGIAAPGLVMHNAFAGLSWTVTAIDALNVLIALAFSCGLLAAWRRDGSSASPL
jgi:hypothetical protein